MTAGCAGGAGVRSVTTTLRHGELRFRAIGAGTGPAVVLLHGFPDHPPTFLPLIELLAANRYRAVAPWLRGYEASSQPADRDYSIAALAGDVIAWLDDMQLESAHLIGHDWGAVVAYAAASAAPHRVASVVGVAVPPVDPSPHIALRLAAAQARKSWYMAFFQLPRLPERALRRKDWRLVRRLWSNWSPGLHVSESAWAELVRTVASPGVVPAALAYYRTILRHPLVLARAAGAPGVPTLVVTGADDGCIDTRMFDSLRATTESELVVRRLGSAGHWPHLEQPGEFAALVLDWLSRDRPQGARSPQGGDPELSGSPAVPPPEG